MDLLYELFGADAPPSISADRLLSVPERELDPVIGGRGGTLIPISTGVAISERWTVGVALDHFDRPGVTSMIGFPVTNSVRIRIA
jgi:hypothetical protein